MKKKILYISSSRADFGIVKNLLKQIKNNVSFDLKILVTGSHLSKLHGFTLNEIKREKFNVDYKVSINLKTINMSKITSKIMTETSNILKKFKPSFVIILGDRYELLGCAISCYFNSIPIVHIHGGEKTMGAIDDSIRHCISKLSFLHLVTHKTYYNRILQLGESKKSVYNVGGLGAESLRNTKNIKKKSYLLKKKLNLSKNYLLITYHSETFNLKNDFVNLKNLFISLSKFEDDYQLIFTGSNFDQNGNIINKFIKNFVKKNKNRKFISSLGHNEYLSLAKFSSAVIGNSSSGILEIPSLSIPTLNLGIRQKGRVIGDSVINSNFKVNSLTNNLKKALCLKLKSKKNYNPYFRKNTTSKIIRLLKKDNLIKFYPKNFEDLLT